MRDKKYKLGFFPQSYPGTCNFLACNCDHCYGAQNCRGTDDAANDPKTSERARVAFGSEYIKCPEMAPRRSAASSSSSPTAKSRRRPFAAARSGSRPGSGSPGRPSGPSAGPARRPRRPRGAAAGARCWRTGQSRRSRPPPPTALPPKPPPPPPLLPPPHHGEHRTRQPPPPRKARRSNEGEEAAAASSPASAAAVPAAATFAAPPPSLSRRRLAQAPPRNGTMGGLSAGTMQVVLVPAPPGENDSGAYGNGTIFGA